MLYQMSPRMTPSMILFLVFFLSGLAQSQKVLPPPCDKPIYCTGLLLHTVQMAGIYNDSKHFVDMVMTTDPEEIQSAFDALVAGTEGGKPNKTQVEDFVNTYFREPEAAFVTWDPKDWKPKPSFLMKISDPTLNSWGHSLHEIWKQLGRQISDMVKNNGQRYSQIYVPNPMIVPGGRFREFYYWDSYWSIEGLLLSNMTQTVKGMLQNFLELVRVYGMVPNGGRVYYERRSQPPYLIPMVKLYVEATGDEDFLRKSITLLETEFLFWQQNRSTAVTSKDDQNYHVAQYNVPADGPRPESYREDYLLAEKMSTAEAKQNLYVDLKSAAESGWDFSSRWFVREDDQQGTMSDLKTTLIAPVDLNSLLCYNAKVLSEFYTKIGNGEKASEYTKIAEQKMQMLNDLFWDEEDGIWHDLDIKTLEKRRHFYISNIHPLWTGCFGADGNKKEVLDKVIKYLESQGVLDYVGGVPTSLVESHQQWDLPNAWAPMQHLIIMALHQSRDISPKAGSLALALAQKWVKTNYEGFNRTAGMFEKYDVNNVGERGGGGEYEVVLGFGWTNGVDMKLLDTFGDQLISTPPAVGRAAYDSIASLSILLSILFTISFLFA